MRVSVAALLVVAGAGCPDRGVAAIQPTQNGAITKTIPVSADVDILFVIDDSASTADKQELFGSNFPRFVQALDEFPGNGSGGHLRPNLHIGITTSSIDIGAGGDLGGDACHASATDGHLRAAGSNCQPITSGTYFTDVADGSGRDVNYTGDLADAFACVANVGDTGCGFESPLEAMKRALDGSHSENAGFIRPGAFLAVVILTDEDDCSANDDSLFSLDGSDAGPEDFRCTRFAYQCDQPISPSAAGNYTNCSVRTDSYLRDPADYYEFLSTLKDPSQIVVALIAGDPTPNVATGPLTQNNHTQPLALLPTCHATIDGSDAIGRPGDRLSAFAAHAGTHGLFQSVCQDEYEDALAQIGSLLFEAVSPCLDGPIDLRDAEPTNPGVQPDCEVSDVTDINTPQQHDTPLSPCEMTDATTPTAGGARPCWWVAPDATTCGGSATPTQLALHVERDAAPPTGTDTVVSCAVDP
nr:hypothetical protein [Kofleriaceae bacterium]